MGSWAEALNVCFHIVVAADESGLPVEATLRDEYAVKTMEDIAKIYEQTREPDKAIAWFMKAVVCASALQLTAHEIAHIFDKLESMLLYGGRLGEAQFWMKMSPRSLDS